MTENFNSMYWIKKRIEHRERAEALRAAEQRERRRKRRVKKSLPASLSARADRRR